MWVNETLPPRARLRWLLMTMRLSIMSFAGTVRTLVAVGTVRLASMFAASDFEAPLRVATLSCGSTGLSSVTATGGGAAAGTGADAGAGAGAGNADASAAGGCNTSGALVGGFASAVEIGAVPE